MSKPTVLVTGAGGFIGFHLARHYLRAGHCVVGADNPDYFSSGDIHQHRLNALAADGLIFCGGDLAQQNFTQELFAQHQPALVFHLAAQASVRSGAVARFGNDNIAALVSVLAAMRAHPPAHFLCASSSSVYGETAPRPFTESYVPAAADNLYADSKFIGERILRFWCGQFPITAVRFFNVYGPWGRQNMAPFYFSDCLFHGREIKLISPAVERAWLYIDDAVDACTALVSRDDGCADKPRLVNVAGPALVKTADALDLIARLLNKQPRIVSSPPKVAEVTSNPADVSVLRELTGQVPTTVFADGIAKFLHWYQTEWLPLSEAKK